MNYYKFVNDSDGGELVAIGEYDNSDGRLGYHAVSLSRNNISEWRKMHQKIMDQLDVRWYRYEITQAEFETYQAFDIKEIKL